MNVTLSDRIWLTNGEASLTKRIIMVVAGVIALAISAKIQVPFGIVQGTFQVLVVMVIGAAYGARMAGATLFSYLVAGFVGLPVFAGPVAGPLYFVGATGGYLIGFLVAATVVGALAQRGFDRNVVTMFVAMVVGLLIIHLLGTAWLANIIGAEKAIGVFTGFVLFDLAKLGIAVIAFPLIWKWVGEAR